MAPDKKPTDLVFACRQLSTSLSTIVGKLFDDCQQAFPQLSTSFSTIVSKPFDNCR